MLLVRHTFSTLALINERRRRESYLFIARDTDGVHCLDSIHTFASNVFVQLSSLSPAFTARTMKLASDGSSLSVDFELTLFSEAVKNVDCAIMQSWEVNAKFEPWPHAHCVSIPVRTVVHGGPQGKYQISWSGDFVLLPSFHFYYRSNQQQRLLHGARW
ncbi:hypothetical protein EV424DRAFT_712646 [Suillus variegatus]|nr:hypothetical protein EV424DRAFT_712646 [Suillus variegatus]